MGEVIDATLMKWIPPINQALQTLEADVEQMAS